MPSPLRQDQALAWLLRGLGVVDLCAIIIAFLPGDVIDRINHSLELATLPHVPLVGYLIRSTSVLYALHGGLMLGLASDVVRYRPLIRLLGWLAMAHGLLIFGVDRRVGMPIWWTWIEGPTFALCGAAVLALAQYPSKSTEPLGAR